MQHPTIIALGEVLWDLFPDAPQFGGAPANFACHAARHSGQGAEHQPASVVMASAVGNDERGRRALRVLADNNVDVTCVETIDGRPTGTVGVDLDDQGRPRFTIHDHVAWDHLTWDDALATRLSVADAVYFGTLAQRGEPSRSVIRRALSVAEHAIRLLDVNLRSPFYDAALIRESVQLCTVLKLSDEELPEVGRACGVPLASPSQMLAQLRQQYDLDLVVMTRGADGAIAVSADHVVEQPGSPVNVVDTVGAGDAFTAALLCGELQQSPRADTLRRACAVAAQVCTHAGAVPG
ncbi:MAG: carbohydrate kinase [Planctomycetaceae bacterium]|nr:carbohydrate kinase [Planctomycetaceae bacterium]